MKEDAILLVDADRDCEAIVFEAVARTGRRVQLVTTSREAFAVLSRRIQEISLVIVDIDPAAHGLALLEAIGACAERPPILALTALEQTYAEPIAREHGAIACLAKPVGVEKLRATIQNLSADRCLTSDHWGHPIPSRINDTLEVKASARGIAAKLSPTTGKMGKRQ
jgi:Response regulators consisting of a CheY-like receiver domain and a winged-helix DNA-binding domain